MDATDVGVVCGGDVSCVSSSSKRFSISVSRDKLSFSLSRSNNSSSRSDGRLAWQLKSIFTGIFSGLS